MSVAGYVAAQITVPDDVEIDVTTNAGGPTTVTITAGDYDDIADLVAQIQVDLIAQRSVTAGTWQVSWSSTTGMVTIAVTNGTYSITFTSTQLRDLLGFTGNIAAQATSTGAAQARSVWMPGCTIFMATRYLAAPPVTDLLETQAPDGFCIGHVGNYFYRHKNVQWTHVPMARVHLADEVVVNESLERFMRDTQWQLGHAWFTAKTKVAIIIHNGGEVGNGAVAGWYINGCRAIDEMVARRGEAWDGVWTVTFPELVSNG